MPSVTTILSKTQSDEKSEILAKWRKREGEERATRIVKESADTGTLIHKHLESYVLKEESKLGSNMIHKTARKMAEVIISNGLSNVSEIWGIETALYYPGLYAGTTDMVGIHKTDEAIIDFKNARSLRKKEYVTGYFHQLCAYAAAHNEVHNTKIRKGVIMMVCRGDTKPADFGKYQEFVLEGLEWQKYADEWAGLVEKYYSLIRT